MFNTLISLVLGISICSQVFGEVQIPPVSEAEMVMTKQIEIPHYPGAYNPSIVSYEDGYLLSFRYRTRFPRTMKGPRNEVSMIGLVKLSKDFEVVEDSVQLLHLASYSPAFSLTAEDGRLFSMEGRLFLIFNDLFEGSIKGECAMYVAEMEERGGEFIVKGAVKPLVYETARLAEKNWSPFALGKKCYCIYADQPERVLLEMDLDTGYCREVSRSPATISWIWGQVRGGTPAYAVDGELLTFFHSSFKNHGKAVTYLMGAYTFEPQYPFSIQAATPQPLGLKSDYEEIGEHKVITFPGGLVVEEDHLHVAWGKDDRKIFISSFDKKKLLKSLKSL